MPGLNIIFDSEEEGAINLLIDAKQGVVEGRVQSKGPTRARGNRNKTLREYPEFGSQNRLSRGRGRRIGITNRLSTRSLNRVVGKIMNQTGLSFIGNIFAGGPAAFAVPLVTGSVAFANVQMNMTLDAIQQRKKTRGVFDIPNQPSFHSILQNMREFDGANAFNKITIAAAHGKKGIIGAISAVHGLVSSLMSRNNFDRALSDAQQDLWRDQLVPHTEVMNSIATLRSRVDREFERGGDEYGGWKELPVIGN